MDTALQWVAGKSTVPTQPESWTALWTAIGAAGTWVAAFAAIVAFLFAAWQVHKLSASIETQSFVSILERAEEMKLSASLDFIRTLDCTDYEQFRGQYGAAGQERVREVIDFFNDIGQLVRRRMLRQQTVFELYGISLLSCRVKLLPWWIAGFRAQQQEAIARSAPEKARLTHWQYFYGTFGKLCLDAEHWLGKGEPRNQPAARPVRIDPDET